MTYCYGCKPRPSGPLPGPILLLLAVVFILIALSSLFPSEPIDFSEFQINWPLLAVPIIILVLVRCLASMDSSPRYYACPCDRGWKMHCRCGRGSAW
ncbi:hypothetical protein Csa_006600 [Cucumis sativus]|uniref:Uncharacterized protein n=1 Tax=Cucumis sativus TaxID=3659 RepID=A0A0A0LJB6_CUCSA|nr:hypothetical protein Csa_006600 [Cucumis sativus]